MSGTSDTPIYDQLVRDRFAESMRRNRAAIEDLMRAAWSEVLSGAQLFGFQLAPDRRLVLNGAQANALILSTIPDYRPAPILHSMRPFPMRGLAPYIAVVDELSVRSRSLAAQQNKHYPKSSPSWARKRKR